ncbi:kinase-like domain-containing protein [Rhizophagus diaphanus]|nr:kinase-like domain-containing protein [Rhizophagus diaphanus] [Rhizophagus sp. MUCL 43196]
MEYVDGSSLQNYLKENFEKLTWEDKFRLAFQLAHVVSCLHNKGIVHGNLNSGNILVHQNNIKLGDLGLSKRINETLKTPMNQSELFVAAPYIDPIWFNNSNNLMQPYSLSEKSDVYSIGVLLWEISSGQLPFKGESYDASLVMQISKGYREKIISDTPIDYSNLYTECWNGKPKNRPSMNQVVDKLKSIITKTCITESQIIQKNDKMNIKETEPTIQNVNRAIFEEDLSSVIDELINLYFEEVNKGKEENVRKQFVIDYINNSNISSQEIYNWLLNNHNDSNSIFLLGYFNNYGIEANINKQKALELYQKAAKLENSAAQFDLAYLHIYGKGIDKSYDKVFELSLKLADREYPAGMNLLGYCYNVGIGTDVDKQKAVELYYKAANLGNIRAQCNLGLIYESGDGVEKDYDKVFELANKSANGKHSDGIGLLAYCYYNGLGTDANFQMAFGLYQEAANLGNDVAQYNLANMYEYGEGAEKNMSKAIYWYKKSAEQENLGAQTKLKLLL